MEDDKGKIIKIDVTGKDSLLFEKLRNRLVEAIDRFLDSAIDYQTGTTVREEAKKLTSLALNFAEEKLKKAGIENQMLLAEIDNKYALAEKSKAEARKLDAETKRIEFEETLKKFSLSLKLTKALILGKEGEEAILLTKQLDLFLEAIQEVQQNQKQIG